MPVMVASITESEYIRQALKGDDEAFTHIVETYQTPVYNLCYRMLYDAQEAEDAAQETFWRAYQGLKRYDQQRPFVTWLLSIAAHYCIDQQRRRKLPILELDDYLEDAIPDNTPDPEKVSGVREDEKAVRDLLKNLGEQDKAAVIMRYWYDFSDEEIGSALDLTVSAVKSRLHRARRELANSWQTNHPNPSTSERRQHESPAF
jgi:RNA polymerase sigma-70 factor, ECF subfamily